MNRRPIRQVSRRQRCATLGALAALAATLGATPSYATASAARDHGKPQEEQAPRSGHGDGSEQGVVQSVSVGTIVLKALDGSVVSVPVDARTKIFVGDRPAALGDIKPGFIVTARWKDDTAAEEVRALDPAPQRTGAGIVVSVGGDRILVTATDGGTTTIRVDGDTRVAIDGKPARLRDVKPGNRLVTTTAGAGSNGLKHGKSAGELRFVRR